MIQLWKQRRMVVRLNELETKKLVEQHYNVSQGIKREDLLTDLVMLRHWSLPWSARRLMNKSQIVATDDYIMLSSEVRKAEAKVVKLIDLCLEDKLISSTSNGHYLKVGTEGTRILAWTNFLPELIKHKFIWLLFCIIVWIGGVIGWKNIGTFFGKITHI